jgi:hypothetical protein
MTGKYESFSGQVKSRLLPHSLLEGALEWLVECLPRRIIKVGLVPTNDISVVNVSKGEFNAIGDAPRFEMVFDSATPLKSGWYYLEAALVRNNGNLETSIRVNIRHEDKESIISLPIPTNRRGTVREVFFCLPMFRY